MMSYLTYLNPPTLQTRFAMDAMTQAVITSRILVIVLAVLMVISLILLVVTASTLFFLWKTSSEQQKDFVDQDDNFKDITTYPF